MQSIENAQLKILINEKGAELKSAFHLLHKIEYMWSGNPAYWAKTSPVLFPIVGELKNKSYFYNGKTYSLSRHGFARDKTFLVTEQSDASVTFSIQSDESTLAVYPFPFLFSIIYTLNDDSLQVTYRVQNTGDDEMFFSVGGHPAFKLPLVDGTKYEDYKLVFEKEENLERWPISKEGLIEKEPQLLLKNSHELPLSKDLLKNDALVFKHLQSRFVKLVSDKTPRGLHFDFTGFPFLGIWAASGADFLCIEPWQGIADSVDADQQLQHKEGIVTLPVGEEFKLSWDVQFF